MKIENYREDQDILQAVTNRLKELFDDIDKTLPFYLALSGGETAKKLFSFWTKECRTLMDWSRFRFFWVDERCVPPGDDDSNFGHANKLLFEPLGISSEHIFRIYGEKEPEGAAIRYSELVMRLVPKYRGLPQFDCIILGVGADAHTASIFPNMMSLLQDTRPYAVSVHPQSCQHRITMTGPVILNGAPLLVPIMGLGKEKMIEALKKGYSETNKTPAAYVLSRADEALVFTRTSLPGDERTSAFHGNQ